GQQDLIGTMRMTFRSSAAHAQVLEIMPATFKKIAYPITPCETNTLWMHHPCDQFGSGQKSGERNTRFINLQHSLPGSCADFAVIITNLRQLVPRAQGPDL